MDEQPCPFESLGRHAHISQSDGQFDEALMYFPNINELRGIVSEKPPRSVLIASNITTQSGLGCLVWAIHKGLVFLS